MSIAFHSKELSTYTANMDAFRAICLEIDGNVNSSIPQSVVIVGEPGSGKTTLLRRLITRYPKCRFVWIDGRYIFSSADIIERATADSILLIDNLDYYFNRCNYDEQFRLRRFLFNEGGAMMIASVSKLMPSLVEYRAPFFEGVKIIDLPPISMDDFLPMFGTKSKSRVETMYNLLPDTIRSVEIISQIIELNANPYKDLAILLSYYSELYKFIYLSLPTNSQHILNILRESAEGMAIPEIKAASGLESGTLTPYLKRLRKLGMISVDKSVNRKTKYSVRDPLFRIWLKREGPESSESDG